MVQANAQLEMLAGRPGSLVIQLDSNPIWGPGTKEGGVDATQVYRDVYSRSVLPGVGLVCYPSDLVFHYLALFSGPPSCSSHNISTTAPA